MLYSLPAWSSSCSSEKGGPAPLDCDFVVSGLADDRLGLAKRMLREADKNEDGRISRDEFYHLIFRSVAPDSLSQYDSRLAKAGTSPDGTM